MSRFPCGVPSEVRSQMSAVSIAAMALGFLGTLMEAAGLALVSFITRWGVPLLALYGLFHLVT